MVVDNTGTFNVEPLAVAKAYIYGMQVIDQTTGVSYRIFPAPAVQPYCTVGGVCEVQAGLQNSGTGPGTLYITVTRTDTNEVIFNQQYYLAAGAQTQILGITFTMPATVVGLRFEIGHL